MTNVRFALTQSERKLILEHGYPFEDFEKALKACEGNPGSVEFELSPYWFEHLLGELARSANHTADRALEGRLDDLYQELKGVVREHGLASF
jgi:hypothetical protein